MCATIPRRLAFVRGEPDKSNRQFATSFGPYCKTGVFNQSDQMSAYSRAVHSVSRSSINSRNMTASLTKIRAQKILTMLTKIKTGRSVRYLTLLRLAGMLAAVLPMVRLGMLNLRPFQRWLIGKHLSAKTQKYTLVKVTYAAWQSLKPWRSREFLMQGVAMGPPPARREIVTTDASQQGWGGVWQQMGVRGTWGKTIQFQHINYLELKAVFLTLTHFSNQLIHKHVLIRSYNVSTVFNINHQGGTRSLKLLQAAHKLWVWGLL